jgi:SagB-type dehydrogenase family enzyme
MQKLSALLWHAARVRATHEADGRLREHRASASGGAVHPISLVLFRHHDERALRYDPMRHALEILADVDQAKLTASRLKVGDLVPGAVGDFILMLADGAKTDAVYEHSRSLIWRDAGGLLATLQLVAVALGLGMCPLGLLGLELAAALRVPTTVFAVGTAVVGLVREESRST